MVYWRAERGQALVEYGLVIALVAIVSIAGLLVFGGTVSQLVSTTSNVVALSV